MKFFFRSESLKYLIIGMLFLSFEVSAQNFKSLILHREDSRKGSSVSVVIKLKGQEIASIESGESLVLYLTESGFMKIDALVKRKNGSSYTAGDVTVNNFFLDLKEGENHIDIGFNSRGRDIDIELTKTSAFPYKENTVRYMREDSPGSLRFSPSSKSELIASDRQIEKREDGSESKKQNLEKLPAQKTIKLIQPKIEEGSTINYHEDELTVKGKVESGVDVNQILINGVKATLRSDGQFEATIKIPYTKQEATVNVFYKDNTYGSFSFFTNREFGEEAQSQKPEIRTGTDYALIFATNSYDNTQDLINPIFDARAIATELAITYNFQVDTVFNPTVNDIYATLKAYAKKMYSEDDQLFIFFAGHGEYDNFFKEGYVLAKDSKANDEGRSSYISHSNLRTIINNIPAEHIFLTMDVCFGGTFDPLIASRGADNEYQAVEREAFIKRKLKYKTRLYLTSGGKTYVPDGRPGHHSPFARRLLDALRSVGGEDGILTYKEILSKVEKTNPEPRYGEFGNNEPGSDFLFIYK